MYTDRITTNIFYILYILLALGFVVNLRAQDANETQARDGESKVRLYDVIILIDGSGSMRQTDPDRLVTAQAMHVVDSLELSDPRNRIAFIFFSNQIISAYPTRGLTNDFQAIRDKLRTLPPPRGGTLMNAPLAEAHKRLSKSNRTKVVILVTDGMADDAAQVVVQLPLFKDIKAPISSVGFSQNADKNFLGLLARRTSGGHSIAATAQDLEKAVEKAIEPPWNVLKLFEREYQGENRECEVTFTIPSHITKSRIRVIYGDKRNSGDIEVKFVSPSGREIATSSQTLADYVSFVAGEAGNQYLLFERLFAAEAGQWKAHIVSKTMSPLPKLRIVVDGKSNLRLVVQREPELERYPYTDKIIFRVGLQSSSAPDSQITQPDDVQIKVVSQRQVQSVSWDGQKAIYQPPRKAETQTIKIVALYQDVKLKESISIEIVHPDPVKIIVKPNPLRLGTIGPGDEKGQEKTTELRISYEDVTGRTRGTIPFTIESMNLYHKRTGEGISSAWFFLAHADGEPVELSRFKGRIPKDGARIRIIVAMPKALPTDLPDGIYAGEMRITSERSDEDVEISVRLQLHRPELLVSKSLVFDLSWGFLPKIQGKLKVSTKAYSAQNIWVTMPRRIDSESGDIANLTASSDDSEAWDADNGSEDSVMQRLGPFEVLPEKSLSIPINLTMLYDKPESVKPGKYEKTVTVEGCGRTKDVPLSLIVPKRYRADDVKKLLMGLAALLFLVGIWKAVKSALRRMRYGARKRITAHLPDGGELNIGGVKGNTIYIPDERLRNAQVTLRRGDEILAEVGEDAEVSGQRNTTVFLKEDDAITFFSAYDSEEQVIELTVTLLPQDESDSLKFQVTHSPFEASPTKTLVKWTATATLVLMAQYLMSAEGIVRRLNHIF